MQDQDRSPWGSTEIHLPAAGLRECVLRAQYMTESEARVVAEMKKTSLYHLAARWRIYRPLQWAELIRVMDLESLEPAERDKKVA